MAGQWDFRSVFINDIDDLLEGMKKHLNDLSAQNFKVLASIADEKGDPAKGVIFYSPLGHIPTRLYNSSWCCGEYETRAKGHDEVAYIADLFKPIAEALNKLPPESAFAAKVLLTDCSEGKATAALMYPTTFQDTPQPPMGIWNYSCYFNNKVESALESALMQVSLNSPDFSLIALADEDDNDAKSVVYAKSGLRTNALYIGKNWKYRTYRTKSDGANTDAYKAFLFDKIKNDLSTLTDTQALAAQIFLTDRSKGNATISLFYPEQPIAAVTQ